MSTLGYQVRAEYVRQCTFAVTSFIGTISRKQKETIWWKVLRSPFKFQPNGNCVPLFKWLFEFAGMHFFPFFLSLLLLLFVLLFNQLGSTVSKENLGSLECLGPTQFVFVSLVLCLQEWKNIFELYILQFCYFHFPKVLSTWVPL